jgi:N-methylhydantoinase B/oxoprolinase/acetone carboxylase alpha subunit
MAKNTLVQIEVLKNALESIADGMALTVVRTSRSQNVRASMDFSTGILTGNGWRNAGSFGGMCF